jgi:hypothetical protein
MFFWTCEVASPIDYLLLVVTATAWIYAAWCLIQLRYERRTPLVWWEPVPFSSTDLTSLGREYHRRFFLSMIASACAILLSVALCASR